MKELGHTAPQGSARRYLSTSGTAGNCGVGLWHHTEDYLETSSKEVLRDDKQGPVSPCMPDTFQAGEQEHARVETAMKEPLGAL